MGERLSVPIGTSDCGKTVRASAACVQTLCSVRTPSTVVKKVSLLAGTRAVLTSTSLKSHTGNVRPSTVVMRFWPMASGRAGSAFTAAQSLTVGFQAHGGGSSSPDGAPLLSGSAIK